ncbi:MAG: SDR family oxidoreductase [Acidobacteria bacterium]|nr:SDR family oxidoreductase [Acidobacteriota bacterium]
MSNVTWHGQRALVTGASSGIGAAIARRLAGSGATLVLTGRDADRLAAVAASCNSADGRVSSLAGDLADPGFREKLAAEARSRMDGIDLLVNNAGISMNARFETLEPEVFRTICEINFFAAVDLTRLMLDDLKKSAGRILVMSSLTGLVGTPTRTAYSASKHALHGFFNALRVELRPFGVGITLVCPGYVQTPIRTRALLGDGAVQGRDQAAGRRMLSADTVAAASLRAAWKRRRLLVLGRETRLARILSLLAPGPLERILDHATR